MGAPDPSPAPPRDRHGAGRIIMSEFDKGADDNNWPQDWDDEKSKTQVKKELQALRDLGKELISLPKKDIDFYCL